MQRVGERKRDSFGFLACLLGMSWLKRSQNDLLVEKEGIEGKWMERKSERGDRQTDGGVIRESLFYVFAYLSHLHIKKALCVCVC